jgi:hypothetical protein
MVGAAVAVSLRQECVAGAVVFRLDMILPHGHRAVAILDEQTGDAVIDWLARRVPPMPLPTRVRA